MKISRYIVEVILLGIVACFVVSPFMKSDAPPTVIHDTVYFLESTSKNGIWLKQNNGMYHFYKVDTLPQEEPFVIGDEYDPNTKRPAPIYGLYIDSCYVKSNGWNGIKIIEQSTDIRMLDKKKTMSLDKK